MSVLAIELNDAGIRAVRDSDPGAEAMPASPGTALLDGGTLLVGYEAYRRARLKPRWTHDRFWEELDTTPLPRPFPRNLRRADLAHAHLEEIWKSTEPPAKEVILAVPGWYSSEQLGLVLGIARSTGMPVTGMVDAALAASALADQGRVLVHLDLYSHRTVASKVMRNDEMRRERIEINDSVGLVNLFDAWVKLIAQIFVRTTRFDPLHRGETEQALYLRLPEWLDELREKESTLLVMEAGGKEHSIELTRDQIVASARPSFEQIAQLVRSLERPGQETTLLLSRRLAELPGLEDAFTDRDGELVLLPAAAGAMGALKMKDGIRSREDEGGELPFITRLPLRGAAPKTKDTPRSIGGGSEDKPAPTHILCDGLAHPITSEPFVLGLGIPDDAPGINLTGLTGSTAGISRSHCSIYRLEDRVLIEDHSSYGSFLNDKRVEGKATLAAGDRLRLGAPGVELRLIRVTESDGTSSKD